MTKHGAETPPTIASPIPLELKDSITPVFTRAALITHGTRYNLKECLPCHENLSRLFLGIVTGQNYAKLQGRKERQPPFIYRLSLKPCFPVKIDETWRVNLTLHPSDTSLKETQTSPLCFFNLRRGQRIALCQVHADKSDRTLTPMPDDTGTLRLYHLGNANNLHSPVVATMILQVI